MKTRLLCWSVILALACGVRTHAGPREELDEATNRLFEAGNYTWETKRIVDFDSSPRPSWGRLPGLESGETDIFRYTVANIRKREIVFFGRKAAFHLKAGWKLAADLDEEEIKEIGFMSGAARTAHDYYRPPAHELLRMILERAHNYRKEGPAIVGNLAADRDEFLNIIGFIESGRPMVQPQPPPSGLSALLLPKPKPFTDGNGVGFVVYLEGGEITEVSIEIRIPRDISFNGGSVERHDTSSSYITRLSKIGTTKVAVDPEAEALFQ